VRLAGAGLSAAVVIGAGGAMGTAIAEEIVGRYDTTVLVGRRLAPLRALAATLQRQSGRSPLTLVADVRDIDRIVAGLRGHGVWDDLELVVNTAGITHYGTHDIDESRLREMIDVNLIAPIALHNAILPLFLARDRGTSIHVLSMSALKPRAHMGGYAATQAGFRGYLTAVQEGLGASYVRITSINPGFVNTPLTTSVVTDVRPQDMIQLSDVVATVRLILDAHPRVRFSEIPLECTAQINRVDPPLIRPGFAGG